jgi:hypothetical protein
MLPEEKIAKMTKAINEAIKVMGDRFGSTEGDVTRAIQSLRESMKTEAPVAVAALPKA